MFQEGGNIDFRQQLCDDPHQAVARAAAAGDQDIRDDLDVAAFDGGGNQFDDFDLFDGLLADGLLLFAVGLGGGLSDRGNFGSFAVADGHLADQHRNALDVVFFEIEDRGLA